MIMATTVTAAAASAAGTSSSPPPSARSRSSNRSSSSTTASHSSISTASSSSSATGQHHKAATGSGVPAVPLTPDQALMELERIVLEEYEEESQAALQKGEKSPLEYCIKDAKAQCTKIKISRKKDRHEDDICKSLVRAQKTSLFALLEAWKTLVNTLKEKRVFMENVNSLGRAFVEVERIDPENYVHLHCLVQLLNDAMRHATVDNSVECRFVTLLEVMLSYGPKWRPSAAICQLWVRLMQRIPADMAAINFRRKAYRVLVSLSWVPSSKGLLAACSFEQSSKSLMMLTMADASKAPPAVREQIQVWNLRAGHALARHDAVNQLLDRLKDETDVCVGITSQRQGAGKTVLAAQVATHPSILRVFSVVWLTLDHHYPAAKSRDKESAWDVALRGGGHQDALVAASSSGIKCSLTYDRYKEYLIAVCKQLMIPTHEWPRTYKRFEEPAIRQLRERTLMIEAKQQMNNLLQQRDANLLLILDHVQDPSVVNWFRFNERQSVIVTSSLSKHALTDAVDWTVELMPMCLDESVELFLTEAGLPANHVLGATHEVRALAEQCAGNPLILRSVGRWFYLKQITAGVFAGLEELIKDMRKVTPITECSIAAQRSAHRGSTATGTGSVGDTSFSHATDPTTTEDSECEEERALVENMMLFDVLSLMMGPTRVERPSTSVLFVLCFAALVVVFPERVPLDEVLLLWEQVLKIEPLAMDELVRHGVVKKSKTSTTAVGGGIGDVLERTLRRQACLVAEGLTHMGVIAISGNDGNPWVDVHHSLYRDFALLMAKEMDLKDTFEATVVGWNRAFVTAYFSQRIQMDTARVDQNSWEYAIEKLPSHMLRGNMLTTTETVLSEQNFFRARIESLGWNRAVDVHLDDCVQLQLAMEEEYDPSNGASAVEVSSVFDRTAEMVQLYAEGALGPSERALVIEMARSLYLIGFALSEIGYLDEAMEQFERAQLLLPQSQTLRASILYGSSWTLLASNETESALKKAQACHKLIESGSNQHVLYHDITQLLSDCLVAECSYKEAAVFLRSAVESMKTDVERWKLSLASTLVKNGKLHHVMGELEEAKSAFLESIGYKIELEESSRMLAETYSALGDVFMDLMRVTDARENYEASLNLLETLECDEDDIEYRLVSGKLLFLRSDFTGCFEALEYVRSESLDSPTLQMDQSAYDLRVIASFYHVRGDLDTAITILQETLKLTDDRALSLERAAGLNELGNCLMDQRRMHEGLVCLEKSLDIKTVKLGECIQVLDAMKVIGKIHLEVGAHDKAIVMLKKVEEATCRVAPNDVERIAEVLYCFGEVYRDQGDFKRATRNFKDCRDVLRCDRSPEHPDIAKALQRLGDVMTAQNDLEKAKEYYDQALHIRKMNFDATLLAETMFSLGVVNRKMGEWQSAADLLNQALEIRRRYPNDKQTAEVLLQLGNVYRLQANVDQAMVFFQMSLDKLCDSEELTSNVFVAIGHVLISRKDYEGAIESYQHAYKIRADLFGANDLKSASLLRDFGLVKFLMNRGEDAMTDLINYVQACQEKRDIVACQSLRYVTALILLGDVFKARNGIDHARETWQAAHQVCMESESIKTAYPDLVKILTRRIEQIGPGVDESDRAVEPKKGSLLTKLSEAILLPPSQVPFDPEVSTILERILVVED